MSTEVENTSDVHDDQHIAGRERGLGRPAVPTRSVNRIPTDPQWDAIRLEFHIERQALDHSVEIRLGRSPLVSRSWISLRKRFEPRLLRIELLDITRWQQGLLLRTAL